MSVEALEDLTSTIEDALSGSMLGADIAKGELAISVKRESIVDVLLFLRDDPECRFKLLMDICGADYPERPDRFEVVYNLLSLSMNQRIKVKTTTDEATPVPSVTGVFSSAGWFEREVWDLFGVYFSGNADLRRILTDYGFDGHPLRKDFPLTGFVELRYDEEQRRVVYEPVQLQQDFRTFDYLSPWEGLTAIQLPGDEKGTVPKTGYKSFKDEQMNRLSDDRKRGVQ